MPIKEVFAPHLGHTVKLGRRRPVARCPRLRIGDYLHALALPAVPPAADFSSGAAAKAVAKMYLNDRYGDCVIAMGYHVIGVETGQASGAPFLATDAQIVHDYSAIGGFDPSNPQATDNGCDEQTALNYWTQKGFGDGSKLFGWASVDATNKTEVEAACYLFENLIFGVELPDAWISPFPSRSGFVWDVGAPDPQNGHAFAGVGYDAGGVKIATWGMKGTITHAAIAALCSGAGGGELYVMLSPDQIARGKAKAPNGAAWSDLVADLASMNGSGPPTPPAPTPGTLLSLADATRALAKGWPSP